MALNIPSNFIQLIINVIHFLVSEMVLNRDPQEEMLRAFKLFNDDDTGKISIRNLRRVAR